MNSRVLESYQIVCDEILVIMHLDEWMWEMSVIVTEQILLHSLGTITESLWIWALALVLSYNLKLDGFSRYLLLTVGIASYILLKNDLRKSRLRMIIITNIHDPYNWYLFVYKPFFPYVIEVVKLEKMASLSHRLEFLGCLIRSQLPLSYVPL